MITHFNLKESYFCLPTSPKCRHHKPNCPWNEAWTEFFLKPFLWNVQKDFNFGKKICSFYQHCFSLLSQCSYRGLAKTWIRNLILREATKVFATTSNSFTFALQQFMFLMRYLLRFTLLVIQRTVRDLFNFISKQTKRYIKCFASSRKWNCYGCYIAKFLIRFIVMDTSDVSHLYFRSLCVNFRSYLLWRLLRSGVTWFGLG